MGYLDLALSYSNQPHTVEAPASGGGLRSFILIPFYLPVIVVYLVLFRFDLSQWFILFALLLS